MIKPIYSLLLLLLLHSSVFCGRPPFLSHVTKDDLQKALQQAKDLHYKAVKQALDNYNTDKITIDQPISTPTKRTVDIEAPGSLPDFSKELTRQVHVMDLLTPQECQQVIQMAEDHFRGTQWTLQKSGQYDVTGFYIKQVPAVHEWFVKTVKQRLFPLLCQQYPDFCSTPDDLCVDNAYLFKYNPETGRRTDVHTDSGCLSFTISLNDDYKGGGTYFEGLQADKPILEMKAGQVTLRPGGVKHCGYPVEEGTRYIIGGFCMHRKKPEFVRQLLQFSDIPALEAAVCLNPECDAPYTLLANAYSTKKEPAKAKQLLEYCLENVHPMSGEVAYSLGSIYMDEEQYEKAKQCFEICLKSDDCDVEAMMGFAQACAKLGDLQMEETYNRRIIELPDANDHTRAVAYCNLGVLYEGKDEEIEYFKKSLEFDPQYAPMFSLASAYADRKQWQEATKCFRRAIPLADSAEYETRALQKLYLAASNLVRSQTPPPTSQEEVLGRFQEIMGAENFQKLQQSAQR